MNFSEEDLALLVQIDDMHDEGARAMQVPDPDIASQCERLRRIGLLTHCGVGEITDEHGVRFTGEIAPSYALSALGASFLGDARAGHPVVGEIRDETTLVPFEDIPLGCRFRYLGRSNIFTVIDKERDAVGDRLRGCLAEWQPGMLKRGKWPGQQILSHIPSECPEVVEAID